MALGRLALTRALDQREHPLRLELDQLLTPAGVKTVRAEYRAAMGPFTVPSSGANAGTIGTAFDTAIRLLVNPAANLALAVTGAADVRRLNPAVGDAVLDLVRELGATAIRNHTGTPAAEPTYRPLVVRTTDVETLARSSWAIALFIEVYRRGPGPLIGPLVDIVNALRTPTAADLRALAESAAVDELVQLIDLAESGLLQPLSIEPAPWFLGPTFAASEWVSADADLIAGSMLVEIKTKLGSPRKDTRIPDLDLATLRQLIAYILHDVNDTYCLDRAAIYEARYGTLTAWPLADLLDQLAGRPVDLGEERARHERILRSLSN